jgi:hypothetical protein
MAQKSNHSFKKMTLTQDFIPLVFFIKQLPLGLRYTDLQGQSHKKFGKIWYGVLVKAITKNCYRFVNFSEQPINSCDFFIFKILGLKNWISFIEGSCSSPFSQLASGKVQLYVTS